MRLKPVPVLLILIYAILALSLLFVGRPYVVSDVTTYMRLALFIAAALLIMITRPLIPMMKAVKIPSLRKTLAWILLSPAALIPLAGYILAFLSGSKNELFPFMILGGFHAYRFYPLIEDSL